MSLEVIKSYLVKLGVDVDNKTFDQSKKVLGELDNTLGGMVKNMINSVPAGAISMVSALAFVDTAIVKTIMNVSEANLQYELLAKRMYLNVDAAKAYKLATDAIGENIQDIAWNAELKSHYFALVRDINSLRVPGEAKDLFKQVRALDFLFTRLKTSGRPFLEWISFELLKLNKGTLNEISEKMDRFVENFIKNIPRYSKDVAEFLQVPIQLTKSFIEVLKNLWDVGKMAIGGLHEILKIIWGLLPDIGKEAAILGGILAPIFVIGSPIIAGAAAFAAALLLIDDYMQFKKGHESLKLLVTLWETFDKVVNGTAKGILAAVMIIEKLSHWGEKDFDWGVNLTEDIKKEWQRFDNEIARQAGKPIPYPDVDRLSFDEMRRGIPGVHLMAKQIPWENRNLYENDYLKDLLQNKGAGTAWRPSPYLAAPSGETHNTFNMSFNLQDYISPADLSEAVTQIKRQAEAEAKAQNIQNRIKTKIGAN